MSEKNEIITTHDQQIETSVIGATPAEFPLPKDDERLIIGAKKRNGEEAPQSGLEVISLADYPRNQEGNIDFHGIIMNASIEAILVDPLKAPDFEAGTGYKGLRKGEVVSQDTLAQRFGKETGFSIAIDEEGALMIENTNPDTQIDALVIKPVETIETVESSETLREVAVEDLGEVATEQVIELNTSLENEPVNETEAERSAEASEDPYYFNEAKAEYDRRVENVLDDTAQQLSASLYRISENTQEAQAGLRTSMSRAEDASTILRRIAMRADTEDDASFARKALGEVSDILAGAYQRLNADGQIVVDTQRKTQHFKEAADDGISALDAQDHAFGEFVAETIAKEDAEAEITPPQFGSKEEVNGIRRAKDSVDGIARELVKAEEAMGEHVIDMRAALGTVDMIIKEAARGELDSAELRAVAKKLQTIAEDSRVQNAYGVIGDSLPRIQGVVSSLMQQ